MDCDFDHVIIGRGSAGCVLAARLSQDPAVSVCLVEAGGFARTQPDLAEPDSQFHVISARVGVESKGIVRGRG